MTRPLHSCATCTAEYTSQLAASLCCDPISNDLETVD